MDTRSTPQAPHVTIRVSGKLFRGHLAYLQQLVQSAADYQLWPLLNLSNLEDVDAAGLSYLVEGENRQFGIVECPAFVREWIDLERTRAAA
jgi:ABC-type transporter Mla MlaB component